MVEHPLPCALEVVDPEEQADSTGELTTDDLGLARPVGPCEQQPGLRSRRPDDDPPLGTPVVRRRTRVLDELERQRVDEEPDGLVVVVDQQGRVLEVHPPTVGVAAVPQVGDLVITAPGDGVVPPWLIGLR